MVIQNYFKKREKELEVIRTLIVYRKGQEDNLILEVNKNII
ncbi:MAG: hypothetical protein ACO2OV_05535 [Thermoproteota archaeon]|jgi:hypothetical protein